MARAEAYDAFGNLLERTGSTPNLYLYAGEQFDPELGLYYNRALYLDVTQGRFWGMDEWEGAAHAPGSLHKYSYANGEPVTRIDPTGQFSIAEAASANSLAAQLNGQSLLNAEPFLRVAIPKGSFTDRIVTTIEIGLAVVGVASVLRLGFTLAGAAGRFLRGLGASGVGGGVAAEAELLQRSSR